MVRYDAARRGRARRADRSASRRRSTSKNATAPRRSCSSPCASARSLLGTPAHERVLDWWATAVDRQAQARQPDERPAIYARVLERMNEEIAEYPGSTAAGYWLAAAARASGDTERAWHAAHAGWLRASLADDRGVALRADLDRLVTQAIIPERAAKQAAKGDQAKEARPPWSPSGKPSRKPGASRRPSMLSLLSSSRRSRHRLRAARSA